MAKIKDFFIELKQEGSLYYFTSRTLLWFLNILPLVALDTPWYAYILYFGLSVLIPFPMLFEIISVLLWLGGLSEIQTLQNTFATVYPFLFVATITFHIFNFYLVTCCNTSTKDINNKKTTYTTIILFLILSLLLIYPVNKFFFQYAEPINGANTYCYIVDKNYYYHNKNCSYLQNDKFKLTISEAIDLGYEQCEYCSASTELSKTCYTTDYGECYHSLGCNSLWNSSNETNVYSAISRGYTACSKCMYSPNLSISCYTTASDNYFHSYFCKYIDNTPIESKQTTVYEAIANNYTQCKICEITNIDTSYKTINNYPLSSIISLGILSIITVSINVIRRIHKKQKGSDTYAKSKETT